MAQTILSKLCVLIVHSVPKNMILSAFPGKIPETGKMISFFFQSTNVGPKPTDQPRSNSVYRILLQISQVCIFIFDLLLKLRVFQIKKNNFLFSQKWLQRIWSNVVGLQYIRNPITWHFRLFPKKKIPETEKQIKPNWPISSNFDI